MFDKILVAIDHSEISDRALAAACDLALLSKGEVWVLYLREREIAAKTGVVLTDETADEAGAAVAAAADKLTAAGVKAHSHVGPDIRLCRAEHRRRRDRARRRCHRDGLARSRRPGGPGPGQHGAQGDSPHRPPGPDRQVTDPRRDAARVELYWLALGPGETSSCARANGRIFEAVVAHRQRRLAARVYDSALMVRLDGACYAIEMAPAWGHREQDRGVVAEGPVGLPWLGRSRFFRYEIRRCGTV